MKQKTRKQTAAALVVTSAPLLYYGFSNFEAGASHPLEAVAISIGCTGGLSCLIGGIYMLFKKDRGVTLASQNVVGDSSVEKLTPERVAEIKKHNQKAVKEFADKIRKETKEEIINKKVKPMAKAKDANINKSVEEIRELEESRVQSEEIIKKETLNAKTITEKIAVLKHSLAKDKTVQELLAMIEK
tara:strand:+ start:1838 stop:2398 length:561 start_codon:yes stop_codon:yes gene_type:complete